MRDPQNRPASAPPLDPRDRLTERVNRARLALEVRRSLVPFAVVTVGVVVGIAAFAWLIGNVSKAGPFSDTRTLEFAVDDAHGVAPGRDQVRFKGIPAGEIVGLDLHNQQAVLTIKLQNSFGPIYRNARAQLLPDTPIEDMHLDIISRGDSSAGLATAAEPIAASQTVSQVDVGQVLDVFQPNVRLHLREMLDNLGNGLRDRGASLREAFIELMPLLETTDRVAQQLSLRRTEVQELIHNSAALTNDLANRQQTIRTLLHEGSAMFGTLAADRANLSATLGQLPPVLQQADTALTALDGVLPPLDAAVTRLRPVASALPGGLGQVRSLSAALLPAVRSLEPAVHALMPLSGSLPSLSTDLHVSMNRLGPQVPIIDRAVNDLVKCRAGVAKFFVWQPTTGVFDDARGPMLRADVQLSATALGLVSTPTEYANKECTGPTVLGGRPAFAGVER
jgi:virulence factor Mce-like protein